jgi:basic membrane protein A
MKRARWFLAVLAVFAFVAAACGDDDDEAPAPAQPAPAEPAQPAPAEEMAEEEAMEEEMAEEETMAEEEAMEEEAMAGSDGSGYSVAFVFDLFIEDGGWNTTHYRGVQAVQEAFPGLEVQVIEEISPGPAATNAFEDLAAEGVDMIVGTTYFMPDVMPVAEQYPDTKFLTWAGWETADNVGHFDGATEDGRYLDGLIAGSVTESGVIGYPAGYPIEEVNRALNAFTIGVREVNPDAVVQVVYINSWYDPPVEQQAAEALANGGADVLAHELNSPAVASVAEDRGLNIIGYSSDRSEVAPNAWLSSFTFEWGPYYIDQVQQMIDGTWEPALTYGGLQAGMIGNSPYGKDVTDEMLALVNERRQQILDGTFDYFAGPIMDNEGNVQVPEGGTIPFEERTTCCLWLIEGVEGSIN